MATSEGIRGTKIGRHRWAWLRAMWNMSREGFKELYEKLPGLKPIFEDIWRFTSGNPDILSQLYQYNWDVESVIKNIIKSKKLYSFIYSLSNEEKEWLIRAVEDPDTLFTREKISLLNKLVELNLVVDDITLRDPFLWIDIPPSERDLELGIGKYVAWQTPLHREAAKRTFTTLKP